MAGIAGRNKVFVLALKVFGQSFARRETSPGLAGLTSECLMSFISVAVGRDRSLSLVKRSILQYAGLPFSDALTTRQVAQVGRLRATCVPEAGEV
ncbi:hypothetical protein Spb1_17700 [Planctopirus ephydatiae]|uniref:Uncharacterized protein n=1 Tax=Planctopirus ephydatiae TaxID=2528019 RepID=A0A518GN29_9PLAN|nr:hypothetical protein Spb1_17700 [Planctopirus ephydatiae]